MIELHGVSRTVPSGDQMLTILHPLDLRIESGRVAAITGPSGSGKSTLLGLIAGLDAPSSGHIVIDGSDITAMSEDALARFQRGRRTPRRRTARGGRARGAPPPLSIAALGRGAAARRDCARARERSADPAR
jgi:ABC-type nitrate/sulfonate/bicarbonate transport system ATPase subunit